MLFVLTVKEAIHRRIIGARDLIIDSAPLKAWRRADPGAAYGHAPAHHPTAFLCGYRVRTLLCRGSSLPVFFRLAAASAHDAPFAKPLLQAAAGPYNGRDVPRPRRRDWPDRGRGRAPYASLHAGADRGGARA